MPPRLRGPLFWSGCAAGLAGLTWARAWTPVTGGSLDPALLGGCLGMAAGARLHEDVGRATGLRGRELFQGLVLALGGLTFLAPALALGADALLGIWLTRIPPGAAATATLRSLLPQLLWGTAGVLAGAALPALFQELEGPRRDRVGAPPPLPWLAAGLALGLALGPLVVLPRLGTLAAHFLAAGLFSLAFLSAQGDSLALAQAPPCNQEEARETWTLVLFFGLVWGLLPAFAGGELLLSPPSLSRLARSGAGVCLAAALGAWLVNRVRRGELWRDQFRGGSLPALGLTLLGIAPLAATMGNRFGVLDAGWWIQGATGAGLGACLTAFYLRIECASIPGQAWGACLRAAGLGAATSLLVYRYLVAPFAGPSGALLVAAACLPLTGAYLLVRPPPASDAGEPPRHALWAAALLVSAEVLPLALFLLLPGLAPRTVSLEGPENSLATHALPHLALAVRHEEDSRVLVLGFRGGILAHELLRYPLGSLDLATPPERQARALLRRNLHRFPLLLRDPRLHFQQVDPWTLLRSWPEPVDLILVPSLGELPGPNFFPRVARALRSGGSLILIPSGDLSFLQGLVRAAEGSLPHLQLYWFRGPLLVARASPPDLEVSRMEQRLTLPGIPGALERAGLPGDPRGFLGHLLAEGETLRIWAREATPLSWDRPREGPAPHPLPDGSAPPEALFSLRLPPLARSHELARISPPRGRDGSLPLAHAGLVLARPLAELTSSVGLRQVFPEGAPPLFPFPLETRWEARFPAGMARLRSLPREVRPDAHREHRELPRLRRALRGDEARHGPHDALWAIYPDGRENAYLGLYTWNCPLGGRSHSLEVRFTSSAPSPEMLLEMAGGIRCGPHLETEHGK